MLVIARRPLTHRSKSSLASAVVAALALAMVAHPAHAQRRARATFPAELRGSQASVQKMWDFATMHGLVFYGTPREIDRAVAEGKLVPLDGDTTYELTRGVGFSYATREAKQFVATFAPQYLAACGTPLVVTSAARPTNRQPRNSNPYSVHPTGIAIDIRRPPAGPCQTWLRKALAELEDQGYVEATEERHPVHLHVAVLTEPGKIAALPPVGADALAGAPPRSQRSDGELTMRSPASAIRVSNPPASAARSAVDKAVRTYRVRQGDTLWDVARRSGVSVTALARANRRSTRGVLKVGTVLRLPAE
jgi:nucleoid-associated protein YgaU